MAKRKVIMHAKNLLAGKEMKETRFWEGSSKAMGPCLESWERTLLLTELASTHPLGAPKS